MDRLDLVTLFEHLLDDSAPVDEAGSQNYREAFDFFVKLSPPQYFNLSQLSEPEKATLLAHDLSEAHLLKSLSHDHIEPRSLRKQRHYRRAMRQKLSEKLKPALTRSARETHFQQEILLHNAHTAFCPKTGTPLSSVVSFPVGEPNTYEKFFQAAFWFKGPQPFFWITLPRAEFWGGFLFFPKQNFIILKQHRDPTALHSIHRTLASLKALACVDPQKTKRFFTPHSPRPTAVVVGDPNGSIYHALVNSLGGLDKLKNNRLIKKPDFFIVQGSQMYGPLLKIFPEISPEKVLTPAKGQSVTDLILEKRLLALRVCDTFFSKRMASRILAHANQQTPLSVHHQIAQAKAQCYPLFWITLRTGNRAWANQVDGIAALLNHFRERFPNLGVVFDGWNRNEEDFPMHGPSALSEQMIQKESALIREISSQFKLPLPVFSTIGCTLSESLAWAQAVDLHFSPHGAGLAKVTLLANRPGIIHTNEACLRSNYFLLEREAIQTPLLVDPHCISPSSTPVIRAGNLLKDPQASWANYECDWKGLIKAGSLLKRRRWALLKRKWWAEAARS